MERRQAFDSVRGLVNRVAAMAHTSASLIERMMEARTRILNMIAFDTREPIFHVGDFIVQPLVRGLNSESKRIYLLHRRGFTLAGSQGKRPILFSNRLFCRLQRRIDGDFHTGGSLLGARVALSELSRDRIELFLVQ